MAKNLAVIWKTVLLVAAISLTGLAACTSGATDPPEVLLEPLKGPTTPGGTPIKTARATTEYPHNPSSFTQGFEFDEEGNLFESTGLNGQSSLQQVDPDTGETLRQHDLEEKYFAEGLTLVEDKIIQLTWKHAIAFVYDKESFDVVDTYDYNGEGWGLCNDGSKLIMSNGSETLTFRNPQTFEAIGTVNVRLDNQPVVDLNELACEGGSVYANVWQTDTIVEINPDTGNVTTVIDAAELSNQTPGGVLNGIGYNNAEESFWLTGKNWSKMYAVEFE